MGRIALLIVAALAACSPRNEPPPAPPASAGEYMFAGDDVLAPPCLLALEPQPAETPGLWRVALADDCVGAYPPLAGVAGWRENEGRIDLVSADSSAVVSFTRGETRSLSGAIGADAYRLVPVSGTP